MGLRYSLKWLGRYLMDHPITTIFVALTAAIEPVIYMIPLFISADIVGILVDGGGWPEVWKLFRILIPLSLIQVLIFFVSSFLNEILAHRITTDMTYDLFNTLQQRSLTYHDGKDVGDIMARATNDTRAVNMGLSPGLRISMALFSIWIVSLAVVYQILGLWFVLIGIVIFLLFSIAVLIYGNTLQPLSTRVLDELGGISAITTDSLSGIRDVKAYTAEGVFKTRFTRQTIKQALTKEREGTIGAWFYPSLIVRIFILSTVGWSLFLTYQGTMSIRDLVLISTIMSLVTGMSEDMNWVSFVMVGTYAATTRLIGFIEDVDLHDFEDGTIEFNDQPASIEFLNVKFSYPNQKNPALDNISFLVNDSETLAIVGSPGSGKSTLTKLIQRLYVPQEGEILLGGTPILSYTNDSLRKHIATVEQDVFLFNDTVGENIKFGKPDATEEEIIHAATIAQAHEFIISFEDGYDTLIGEDGVRLSGGQAQRIAIARALMVNPEILIFDDGASALDAKTEAKIQHAIAEILKTRTTIITTHRLAIIAQADKILILDKGTIKGFGSHEELIQQNLYYRKLFEKHFELPPLQEVPR